MTLLNNWENTGFKFDEKVLVELMKEAKHLGVDMFLLDDGWFANKYPRNNDHTGLGDWEATKASCLMECLHWWLLLKKPV